MMLANLRVVLPPAATQAGVSTRCSVMGPEPCDGSIRATKRPWADKIDRA